MVTPYDSRDRRVLAALRTDSRGKLLAYIRATRMPKSTVHDRINRLVKCGVRCTSILNWDALGCPFAVFALLPYDPQIAEHPSINSCARLTPDLMLAECLFSTARGLEDFKTQHPGAKIYPIIASLKREGFIPESDGGVESRERTGARSSRAFIKP